MAGGRRLSISVILWWLLAATTPANAAKDQPILDAFAEFVPRALQLTGTPGAAVAVVRGDKVVLARGFGVRDVTAAGFVDEDTLFAIGSNSKYFTATALGLLVAEDVIDWDTPLHHYLGELRYSDAMLYDQLNLVDALSHRSGLERADMAWYVRTSLQRSDVLAMVETLSLEIGFRSGFIYNNFMFLAAGEVIPVVTGQSWDDFLQQRLFDPLGMQRSNTSVNKLEQTNNVASPHTLVEGRAVPIPWFNLDAVGPAGSINSSARDMAQWCRVQLGGGKLHNERVIPESVIEAVRTPRNPLPLSTDRQVGDRHKSYALGIYRLNYGSSHVAYMHEGGIDGMRSNILFIPDASVCFVALTNNDQNSDLHKVLTEWLADHYLGLQGEDYLARRGTESVDENVTRTERDAIIARVAQTPVLSELVWERYAGDYINTTYGTLDFMMADGELRFSLGQLFVGVLQHHSGDSFRLIYDAAHRNAGEPAFVSFTIDAEGEPESVLLQIETFSPSANRIRFLRNRNKPEEVPAL